MRKAIIVAALAGLTACTADGPIKPQYFRGPSGKDAYTMRCSQAGRTWAKCYTKAGEICPNGYLIIGQHSERVVVPSGSGIMAWNENTLVVECK